jgi:hypothetical protein
MASTRHGQLPNPNDWSVKTTTDIDNQLSSFNNRERLDRMERMLEKVCDRLAILDEPDPERLEAFKQLQEAYKKYKFVDELCGPHDNGSED